MRNRLSLRYWLDRPWLRRPFRLGSSTSDLLRLFLFGLILVGLVGSIIGFRWGGAPHFEVGQVATLTIKAPRTYSFTSEVQTEAARRDAAQDTSTIQLHLEPAVAQDQLRRLAEQIGEITRLRQDQSLSISARLTALQRLNSIKLSDTQANDLLNLDDIEWTQVAVETRSTLMRAFERQIVTDEINVVRALLSDWVRPGLSETQRRLVAALASPFVRENVVVDTAATERNRQRAREEVQPVRVTVQLGEAIIRDGQIIGALDLEKLEQIGLRDRSPTLLELIGTFSLVALLVMLLLFYVMLFQPSIWRGSTMLLVGLIIVGTIAAGRLIFPLHPLLPYAFPVATAAMLLAVLLDVHLAVIAGALLALLLGLTGDNSLELVVLYFLTAVGGAFIMWRADRSARFLLAGLMVSLTDLAVAVSFRLASQNLEALNILQLAGLSALNGILSSSLTFVAFSLLGSLFGITTVLQLLELAHPNQPLLRRLAREAPGTYHHSLVVSSLAENAAEMVGGDTLFTRVAVYYHDIGKLMRPYFFVENQVNMANIHDDLDPHTSAKTIISHVADGVSLARRHRLPRRIVDTIQQHHGTTRVNYFLHKARERDDTVDERDFTYPGPRPRTKEAAIIMLADAVEATVRAQYQAGKLQAQTPTVASDDIGLAVSANAKIAEVVNRIINERIADGQLDECDLTLKDLTAVRTSFVGVLTNIYHPRIDYPSGPKSSAPIPSDQPPAESPPTSRPPEPALR